MASIHNVKFSKGKTYTFRLYVLLYDIGSPVLRELIRRLILPDTLQQRLSANRVNLQDLKSKKNLLDVYYSKLFPGDNAATSSDDFDFSLLIYLLRAICGLRQSSDQIWSKMPASNDNTDEANITRLKLFRNWIFHAANTEYFSCNNGRSEEDNFAAVWVTIKTAILDLDAGFSSGLSLKIEHLFSASIDPSTEEKFQEEKERLGRQAHYNAFELTKLILKSIEEKAFVKTKSFQEARDKLIRNRIVVLKGNPGEGKTTMSRMLACEVRNGMRCLNLITRSDWRKVDVDVEEHRVIIIDDIFGASVLDDNEFKRWQKVLKEIETVVTPKESKLHIIVTSRNYILNEALKRMYCPTIFTDENTVKLSSEHLSDREKKKY